MNTWHNFKVFMATALLLLAAGSVHAVSLNLGFNPASVANTGDYSILQVTVSNDQVGVPLTNVGWSNSLPTGMTVITLPSYPQNSCNNGTLTATPGTGTITFSGGTVPAKVGTVIGICNYYIPVLTTVQGHNFDTIPAGNLTNLQGFTNTLATNDYYVKSFASPNLVTSMSTSTIFIGQTVTLSVKVTNTDTSQNLTQASWANTLPAGLLVNGTPTSSGCGSPALTGSGTSIAMSNAIVLPSAVCQVDIPVIGTGAGTFTLPFVAGSITDYQGVSNTSPVNLQIAVQSFTLTKNFVTNPVKTNQVTKLQITLASPASFTSLAFNDDFSTQPLMAGVFIANPSNVGISGACTGTVNAVPGSQSVSLTNGTLTGNSNYVTPASCVVSVDVIIPSNANAVNKTNTLAAGTVTGVSGGFPASNVNPATSVLTVNPYIYPTMSKSFATDPIFVGQSSLLTINLTNNDSTTFTNVAYTDTLPAGLVVNGAATKNPACSGGSVSPSVAGGNTISLSGVSIAAGALCTVTVPVTATRQGTNFVNTIPTGSVTDDQGTSNNADVTSTLNTANSFTASKTFNGLASTTIAKNQVAKLRITISNQSIHAYNSIQFSDNWSVTMGNLVIATPSNVTSNCGSPSFTAVTGSKVLGITGGSIGAGAFGAAATCYVEVDVISPTAFTSAANTIAIGGITAVDASNSSAASNYQAATASLAVSTTAAPTLTKSYSVASPIYVGQAFNLLIDVKNNDGTLALSNTAWTDTLPTYMMVNGTAVVSTLSGSACSGTVGTVGQNVNFTAGNIPAGTTCRVTVPVVITKEDQVTGFTNQMPAGAITDDQMVTNTTVSAIMKTRSFVAVKSFSNNATHPNLPTTLFVTFSNYSTHIQNSVAFSDTLTTAGATFQVAPTPATNTTCGGIVSAAPGASSFSFSGGTLAAGTSTTPSTCIVQVNVLATGTLSGTNNIPAANITATDATSLTATNSYAAASASITVTAIATPTFTKSFGAAVNPGATATLTINLKNNELAGTGVSLTGVTWSDIINSSITITGTPVATPSCGSPSLTVSGQTIYFGQTTGGTIAPQATCTVTVTVVANKYGTYANSINNLTTNEGVTTTASGNLTVNYPLTVAKTFNGSAVYNANTGQTVKLRITITNNTPFAMNSMAVTDTWVASFGAGAPLYINSPAVVTNTCGGTTIPANGATVSAGTQVFSLSGGSIAAGVGSCYFEIDTTSTGVWAGNKTNTITANNATCTFGGNALIATDGNGNAACDNVARTATLAMGTFSTPTIVKARTGTNNVYLGQTGGNFTITIANTDTSAPMTNVSFTDTLLPGGQISTAVSGSAGCIGGTLTGVAGTNLITWTGGQINASSSCVFTVPVAITQYSTGTYTNTVASGALTYAEGSAVTLTTPAASITNKQGLSLSKAFSTPTVVGNPSTLTITISNNDYIAHTGLALTEDFTTMMAGANVVIAPTPSANSTCNATSTPVITATPGATSFSFSNGSIIAATGATAKTCTITISVVSNKSSVGLTNTIPIGALTVTDGSGANNTAIGKNAIAWVVNATKPTVLKTFTTSPIRDNGIATAVMTIKITNVDYLPLSSLDVTDDFTAITGLSISSFTSNTCNGALSGASAGSTSLHLTGGTIAAFGNCSIVVNVVSTMPINNQTNTAYVNRAYTPYEAITTGMPATGTANITATDNITLTKKFNGIASSTVPLGSTAVLSVDIFNDSAVTKTGVSFTDTFPTAAGSPYYVVDTPANLSNGCNGTLTVNANGGGFTYSGGTIAANSTCTISLNVVGVIVATAAQGVNTLTAVSTSPASTAAIVSANLAVTALTKRYSSLTKAFSTGATPINLGGNSTVTITWTQTLLTSANPVLTDNLPRNIRVADTPNVTATCSVSNPTSFSTTVNSNTYSRDQIVVSLTKPTQALNEVCTVKFDVTGAYPGTFTNTIAVGDIRSSNGDTINTGGTNPTASASITVLNVMTIAKAFQPNNLAPTGVSTLKITITNPEAQALTGVGFTDTLPAVAGLELVVANPANATTDCTINGLADPSKVTAVPGGGSVILAGGVVPAQVGGVSGICTVTVSVTPKSAPTSGSATNTIPIGAITSNENRTNIAPAASDTVYFQPSPTLYVVKSFNPLQVTAGVVSQLKLDIGNPSAFAQTGLSVVDRMPVGMSVGAPPNPSSTCGSGWSFIDTDTGGALSVGTVNWKFQGGSMAAGANCTVTLNVSSATDSNLSNRIEIGALTSTNGGSNSSYTIASLANLPGVSVAKSFSPNPQVVNQPVRLTIVLTNVSSTVSLSNMTFLDDFTLGGTQTGMTVSATPNLSNNCGGTITYPGNNSVNLTGGALNPNSTCTILVDVVTDRVKSYTNTIPAGTLSTSQGVTNAVDGTITLPVYAAIRAVKQISPASDGGRFVLTMTPAAPSGVSSRTNVGNDATPTAVTPFFANEGTTYTLTETGQGATALANYISTYVCKNADNTTLVSGTGTSVSVTPPTTAGGATKNQQDITCIFTNVLRQPLVSVYKTSIGGVGSFTFTGTNGLPTSATTITTTTAGIATTTAALTEVALTAKNVAFSITEGASGNFVMTGASCTGLQGTDTATLVGNTLTIPSTSNVDGARIVCTYTNTQKTLTLQKNITSRRDSLDQFQLDITGAGTGTATTSGSTTGLQAAQASSYAGAGTYTIAESMATGSVSSLSQYNSTVSCSNATGGGTVVSGVNSLGALPTLTATDVVTCTIINTPKPVLTKAFSTGSIGVGGVATLTFTITNSASSPAINGGLTFTDSFPTNLVIAATPGVNNTCGGSPTITANTNAGTFTVGGSGVNAAAGFSTCTISVNVTSSVPLSGYVNGAAQITSISGNLQNNVTNQTLNVIGAPVISKVFSPVSINAGGSTTLTFTLSNPNPFLINLSSTAFTDVFPTTPGAMLVASPLSASTTCAGTLKNFAGGTTTAGDTSIRLDGGSIAANSSCTVTVNVTASAAGSYLNTSSTLSSVEAGTSAGFASASLTVAGYNVTGKVYNDVNHNGMPDSTEDWTGGPTVYTKLFAGSCPATGTALSVQTLTTPTGAYTFTGVASGSYCIVLSNNSTNTDTTTSLPANWFNAPPSSGLINLTVAGVDVPNQNFGLFSGSKLAGRVFLDTGSGGGTANNGAQDGTEPGIGGVTVTANQAGCAGTICATAVTDGNGDYTMWLPATVTGSITVTETNLSGYISTGGQVGNTSGVYVLNTDTTTFTVVSGTNYTGVNFADVPNNQFLTDGAQSALPGSVVFYPHTFVAGTAGTVSFTTSRVSTPVLTGWNEVIYLDANCNAVIDAGEVIVPASVSVTAAQNVCLLVKEFVPAAAPVNAQNAVTVTATFTESILNAVASYVRHDTTTVGQTTGAGLTLVKTVSSATALPGDNLTYTINYLNNSSGILSNLVIDDATPAYTTFFSASCGVLPLNLTSCAIAAPVVGAAGSIVYTMTGTLAPGGSGVVTFKVIVQP
jgi:uncharacterized repeat protein (TIGR01451 family)